MLVSVNGLHMQILVRFKCYSSQHFRALSLSHNSLCIFLIFGMISHSVGLFIVLMSLTVFDYIFFDFLNDI